jgi:hypothetical protein
MPSLLDHMRIYIGGTYSKTTLELRRVYMNLA